MTSDYAAQQQPGPGYAAAQNPASLYAKQGGKAAPAKAKAPAGKSPGKGGEVTILGRYLWQPPISGEEEVQYFLDHKWHPSFEDYVAITGIRPALASPSRLDRGSSISSRSGADNSVRAMATRWRSPPDSFATPRPSNPAMPV